jgi:hypothetical protein
MKTILCDIDGVIADCTHRLSFIKRDSPDWDAFFAACEEDEPMKPMIEFLQELELVFRISYVTGRPERTRNKTIAWLKAHDLPWDEKTSMLWMREDGDHRPDFEIKLEIFRNYVHSQIAAVIEDRDQVVQMWRELGLLCLQPKKGDY